MKLTTRSKQSQGEEGYAQDQLVARVKKGK